MLVRVAAHIQKHSLIPSQEEVTCLVSGGADSTCLWHSLRALGYDVRAVHVHHGLRGAAADEDAAFCREMFGAEVIRLCNSLLQRPNEALLRHARYEATAPFGLRATGHTASDQVETLLLGLLASGSPQRIKAKREDGVVRPLLTIWREETEAYCREHGLAFRTDSTNEDTKRGLIRRELLPLLERLDPRARASLLSLAAEGPRLPRTLERTLAELLSTTDGTKQADLGRGITAVREYGTLRLEGAVTWGPWTIESDTPGLAVRGRRPGDRLAGRRKKVQDLLVDAKVPKGERDAWPVVVKDDDVVALPGIAEAPGWEGVVSATRGEG